PRGDAVATAAFGAVVLGGLLLVRALGLWPGDVVVWPLAAALVGLALLAMRTVPSGATVELPDWQLLRRLPPDAADAVAVLVGTRRGALARIARMQERELRGWLLAGDAPAASASTSLGAALEELAASIEAEHGVPVEVVRVRDCGIEGTESLRAAAREAILNAARHSGAAIVSVYLEVEPEQATIFVRDRGRGFDPDAVPVDRGGSSPSMVGRRTRAGRRARMRSGSEEATAVEL